MKEIRELDRASLSTEQKLGLLLCANLCNLTALKFDEELIYKLSAVRERL